MSKQPIQPKPQPPDMLYTVCEICDGTGGPVTFAGRPPGPCVCARGGRPGMIPSGVTLRQLDRLVEQERAAAGDPGLDPYRRGVILAALERKVKQGLRALGTRSPVTGDRESGERDRVTGNGKQGS